MRKRTLLCVVMIVTVFTASAQAPDLRRMDVVERSVPAGPVAMVDGVAIEGADFLREYRRQLLNFMQIMDMPEVSNEYRVHAGLTVLGEMIRHEIMLKEAQARNLSVPDGEVEARYQEKLAFFAELLSEELGESPNETQVLERAGQTREEARASVREQLLVEKVSDIIAESRGVNVSAADVRTYYENNPHLFERPGNMHLSQILVIPLPDVINADETAWQQAEEKAERARARILAGEQFAAVARDVSDAPDAGQGGDMGVMPASHLPPFFVEIAVRMQPGELSGVFRSEFGVHVIRLEDAESAGSVSLEEAEPAIRRMLHHIQVDEAVLDFCEPIVNDTQRTRIFLQLDRTLATQGTTSAQ